MEAILTLEVRGAVTLASQSRVPDVLTCRYRTAPPRPRTCAAVTATVNTDPQPYTDFDRWEVEASQEVAQGGRHDEGLLPRPVRGIGLASDWVPAIDELEAVNATRWVTIILGSCSAHAPALHLAKRLIRVAMVAPVR